MELSKYKFYFSDNKVIAVSSYAGKTVRGIAKCSPHDSFDVEKGKMLAALRCEEKIAKKRMQRSFLEYDKALQEYSRATIRMSEMKAYEADAVERYNASTAAVENELSCM